MGESDLPADAYLGNGAVRPIFVRGFAGIKLEKVDYQTNCWVWLCL